MPETHPIRSRARAAVLIAGLLWCATTTIAIGPSRSFTYLQAPATQELYGETASAVGLGGVAFAPDGDIWAAECRPSGTRLHRYDLSTVVGLENGTLIYSESVVDLGTAGGCGLVNHADGFMYSNSEAGIWRLDADTGLPVGGPIASPAGNGTGIAVDPAAGSGNHLIYAGVDCNAALRPSASTCTVWDFDPATGDRLVFARLNRQPNTSFDSLYVSPSGEFVFVSQTDDNDPAADAHSLVILNRPAALKPVGASPDDSQIAQRVSMTAKPGGVSFNSAGFVVTLDQSFDASQCVDSSGGLFPPDPLMPGMECFPGTFVGGTMTRLDFPGGNFAAVPAQSSFAMGGFRGGLSQVGVDGCIYATQGGVRYDSSGERAHDSLIKVCGGFIAPAGVDNTQGTGVIGDFVWNDANGNGLQDSGDTGIDGVTVTLRSAGGSALTSTTTSGGGAYQFTALRAGTYSVEATTPPGLVPTTSNAGSDPALDSSSSPASVTLATDSSVDTTVDFGYRSNASRISGFAYADWNRNGVRDGAEPGLSAVTVVLSGVSSGSAPTAGDGSYDFPNLASGAYQVSAPSSPTVPLTLAPGSHAANVNLGFVETVAPVCTAVVQTGNPTRVVFTVGDAASGLRRIRLTQVTNFSVVTPGGAVFTAPATVDFDPAVTGNATVTASRVNAAQSASVTFEAVDVFGNTATCVSPAVAATPTDPPPPDPGPGETITKVLHGYGRDHVVTVRNVLKTQRYITVTNKRPGLLKVTILVNHKWYFVHLWNDRVVKLDVGKALQAGHKNKIVLVGWGRPRGSAVVTISDKP